MSISLAPMAALRRRLAALRLYAMGALVALATAAAMAPDAVATRFVEKLGVGGTDFRLSSLLKTALAPAEGAGESEIMNLLKATVAVVLLGAFVYFLVAIFKTVGGRRGGVESILTIVFALIVGIAGLEVLG